MNKVNGIIKNIRNVDGISHIHIDVEDNIFSVLLLDDTDIYRHNENVNLIFKETEVMICTNASIISARNAFISEIISITVGDILAEVHFDFHGVDIASIITKGALLDMQCKVGDSFKWFVKSNEVNIKKTIKKWSDYEFTI